MFHICALLMCPSTMFMRTTENALQRNTKPLQFVMVRHGKIHVLPPVTAHKSLNGVNRLIKTWKNIVLCYRGVKLNFIKALISQIAFVLCVKSTL